MASAYKWFFLVCLLCIFEFGLYFCSMIMFSGFFAISGFVTVLLTGRDSEIVFPYKPLTYRKNCESKLKHAGILKIIHIIKKPSQTTRFDKRLTGSVKVDEPLQEIISNISRDFILSWYSNFSLDEEFLLCIKELFKSIINNISRSTIEVDWVSFFTKHVVDDFASHLRLFRISERAMKIAQKEQPEKNYNLESIFFDMELTMEKTLCRDIVCTSDIHEKRYLLHLVDILLYLLLPLEDFKNTSFRVFLRDLVTMILQPTICLFADPDFINQNLIWLCKDCSLGSKPFLTVLRRTDSLDELSAVKEIAKHELKVQKSKDTRDRSEMKQYIKSITFVHDLANQRYQRLMTCCPDNDMDYIDISIDIEWKALLDSETKKLISLPFDIVLNNNVGLHYFTEFMSSINAQEYVFFYHNIEGFRTTAETLLSGDEQSSATEEQNVEKLREFAMQIFDAYLGENAVVKVKLDENLLAKLYSRMKTEKLNESFYDSVQSKVYDIMLNEFYTTSFKASPQYVKLLAELELLPDFNTKDDESLCSSKSDAEMEVDATLSCSDQDIVITELLGNELPNSEFFFPNTPSLDGIKEHRGDGLLTAEIYNTGITHHAGKTFAVYAIAVSHHLSEGPEKRWFVVRRYSEFHEFHRAVCEKYPRLSNFEFPSKKAFNNLSRHLMEKRRHMLNKYLQFLLSTDVLNCCHDLQFMLYNFLEPRVCEKGKKSFVRTVGTLVSPIKTSVKTVGSAVKLVPTTLFSLKDGLFRALSKNSNRIPLEPNCFETDKVSAGLDLDAEDIPVRIILLLLDEVFDLKSKDLWFRRRIIALMRQIIKTTQGDAINKKLKNYVDGMASANQVAWWLKQFSQTFWPNGILAQPQQERDNSTKLRTKVAAKTLLLCSIPDELKHIIGSETSCKGAMTIFHLFQNFALNRRLVYVLLEHFLVALFPQNNISKVLELLHCESPRITPIIPISEEHFGDQTPKTISKKCTSIKNFSSNLNTSLKFEYKSQKLAKPDLEHYKRKRRRSLSYIDIQDNETYTESTQKRKISLETAIFYTDITNDQIYGCSDNLVDLSNPNM